ncbi:hypothetical protein ONZ43_g318 [Nemania bipapillata]|uniref:Uncharacterized protein n=1 Tax=Nemania bipapillata TaxID=110536 RepID=A0ACC2J8Z0_9PEZI|nr:hypothetical protein ONZ43_g318 [Nemania bipapillata]
MTALAAIINRSVEDDQRVDVYFNTSKAQLGISLESGDSTGGTVGDWQTDDDDYNGYILNPSEMAGIFYRGLPFVAAVTIPKLPQNEIQTQNQISLVAPVYKKLTTTSLDHSRIAISLGAWYDPEENKRHVVFQGSGLSEYIVEDDTYNVFVATYGPNTTLAAVYSSATKKAYVYYLDSAQAIQRVVKTGITWGVSTPVSSALKVAAGCQLTVVNANNINHLFYTAQNQSSSSGAEASGFDLFTHFRDPVN